jgi:hypothetical protein
LGVRISETGRVLNNTIKKFVSVTAEVWKGFNRDARLHTPPGEDSVPCKDDQIILVKIDGTGKYIAVGVLDVSQGAKAGEKIFYCRDADGAIKAKISMLNDGAVKIEADGDITQKTKGAFSAEAEKDASLKSAANTNLEAAEKATVKGADVSVEGKVKISGGNLECNGTASPTGTGCFCALPFCTFTGAPQTGNKAEGT